MKKSILTEQVIIAGFGGQGILFTGLVLAQAGLNAGLNVTFFPSYGAEMRGGKANCSVILSSMEIGSPVFEYPQSLMIMSSLAMEGFLPRLLKDGLVIINSSLYKNKITRSDVFPVYVPLCELAETSAGDVKMANMCMLGAYLKHKPIVNLSDLTRAVEIILVNKPALISPNQLALKAGYEYK